MENVQYSGYPVHEFHVQICWADPGTLVWTTPNNHATNLFFTALTGMGYAPSTTGTPFKLQIKNIK